IVQASTISSYTIEEQRPVQTEIQFGPLFYFKHFSLPKFSSRVSYASISVTITEPNVRPPSRIVYFVAF
ncbi:hypothetical protein ACPTHZ_14960, partial [Enterococcus faecium]|uniref:hypothetical protein n=1 Tax=Enterococcus faecium TaxID=1352 RepID=UPI003CC69D35